MAVHATSDDHFDSWWSMSTVHSRGRALPIELGVGLSIAMARTVIVLKGEALRGRGAAFVGIRI